MRSTLRVTAVAACVVLAAASASALGQARPGGGAAGGSSKGSRLTPPSKSKLPPAPERESRRSSDNRAGNDGRDRSAGSGREDVATTPTGPREIFERIRIRRADPNNWIERGDGARVLIPEGVEVGAVVPGREPVRNRLVQLAEAIRANGGKALSPEERAALVRRWEDPEARRSQVEEARRRFTAEDGYVEVANEMGDTVFARSSCCADVKRLAMQMEQEPPTRLRSIEQIRVNAQSDVQLPLDQFALNIIDGHRLAAERAEDPCSGGPVGDRLAMFPYSDRVDPFLRPTSAPWVDAPLPANLPEPREVWSTLLASNPVFAVEAFTEHLRLAPFDAEAQRGLALGYFGAGNAKAGVRMLWLAHEQDPSLHERAVDPAWIAGGLNQIRAYTRRAVVEAHASGSGEDWFAVAALMTLEGRTEPARAMLDRAIASGASGDQIERLGRWLVAGKTTQTQP